METTDPSGMFALLGATLVLCCCCLALIGGGLGVFVYYRNRQQKKTAAPTTVQGEVLRSTTVMEEKPDSPAAPPASDVPSPFSAPASPAAPKPPASAEMTVVRPMPRAEPPPPAGPIEADDIRAKLLALNGPDKLYEVQASGYRIIIAPLTVTGYLLEISFDYTERVARFVETNTMFADPQIKQDARQVLEANGWTVRE
ncbi:MAG: hypothetical protein RMK99_05210 [Anaerolineales bacterium]|nr:hypothetical protein [Anaerolineales bacterium]